MDRADFEPFRKMMTLVAEQYAKPMSPDLIRLYFDGLAHLPLDAIRTGLNKHLRNTDTGQFMPKIADVIRACSKDSKEERALIAWEKVRSKAPYDDPAIDATIESMGGWRAIGQRQEAEWLTFGAQEFMRRYEIYDRRQRTQRALLEAKETKQIEAFAKRLAEKMEP